MENNKEYRNITLRKADIKDNRITVSFSSEEPYLRSFGYEILSHDEGDYDFSFLDSGNAPFLLDHNPECAEEHIGLVESAKVDNKRGIATILLSSNPDKQGIVKDIQTIRKNISVGYYLTSKEQVGTYEDNKPIFKCKWKAFEISSVAIPADTTVGTNRATSEDLEVGTSVSLDSVGIESKTSFKQQTPLEIIKMEKQELEVKSIEAPATALEVLAYTKRFGLESMNEDLIRSASTLSEVKEKVLEAVEKRAAETPVIITAPAVHTRKQESFSIAKGIRAASSGDWSEAGYEREMSQENAKLSGKHFDGRNIFIDPNMPMGRAATVAGTGTGAELVGTTFRPDSFISMLYAKTLSDKLGVTNMLGLVGNQRIPVMTSGVAAQWGTEVQALTNSDIGTGKIDLTPKDLTAKSSFSRQLMVQGLPAVEAMITADIMKQLSLAIDTALIGAQTQIPNAPVGLMNLTTMGVAGAQTVVAAGDSANGSAALTWTDINNIIKLVDNANALDGSLKFVTNPKVAALLKSTVKAASTAVYLMGDDSKVAGYDVVTSTIVPSTFTKGTSTGITSPLIFGNWNEAIVAQWGAIELVVDPYSAGDNSQIVVRAYTFADAGFKHTGSFANTRGILAG